MNTNTHSVRRRIAACAAAAVVLPAFTACGADVEPPAQDISRQKVDTKDTVPTPKRTSGSRLDFGDEQGRAGKIKPRKAGPAGNGTRNRKDFRDPGW